MAVFSEPPRFTSLWESVEYFASRTPEHSAIDDGIHAYSYAQLCRAMNGVATTLKDLGVATGDRVGILIDNGILAYASILGALRAGNCYVALNPALPPGRIRDIIADSDLRVLITVDENLDLLAKIVSYDSAPSESKFKFEKVPVLVLRGQVSPSFATSAFAAGIKGLHTLSPFSDSTAAPASDSSGDDDLAYIMYTSGSTGRAKGVMVSRGNVMAFIRWAQSRFGFTPNDRFSGHSRISFDLSVFDMFCALQAGATLCPITKTDEITFPASFIERQKITVWFSVPSVLRQMLSAGELTPRRFSKHLRHAIFCGEALLPSHARAWQQTHPDVPLFNLYGPTEATVACSHFRLPNEGLPDSLSSVPIGDACDKMELLIVDDEDRLVPAGKAGRLIVCGPQVAKGYWRNPELTEKMFFRHPLIPGAIAYDTGDLARFDDSFGFIWLGRKDEQVKIHGHRVELSEIESALVSGTSDNPCGFATEAVALLTAEPDSRIIAIVAPRKTLPPQTTDDAKLKAELMERCLDLLPAYMIPTEILLVDKLPKSSNGKVCRRTIRQAYDVLIDSGKVSVSFDSTFISDRLIRERLFHGNPLPILIFELAKLLSAHMNKNELTGNSPNPRTGVNFHVYFEDKGLPHEALIRDVETLWPFQIDEMLQNTPERRLSVNDMNAIALRVQNSETFSASSADKRGIEIMIEDEKNHVNSSITVALAYDHEMDSPADIASLLKEFRSRMFSYSSRKPDAMSATSASEGQRCDRCLIEAKAYRERFPTVSGMMAYFRVDGRLGSLCHVCADGYR